ncbi:MAG: response regulator [Candidatus Hydrogenedentes bacterium]|nr:response regulator [Candidatus Hydrogenedentota bacterium]
MARILLVDDDITLIRHLAEHLTAAGHLCRLEGDGQRALDMALGEDFDLLIVDVMLPRVSGFEICRRVRADAKRYTLPIIILSAMNEEEEIMHGLAQGAEDYVTKPFRLDNFLSRVERLLQTNSENAQLDDLTDLPGPKAMKLEIQRIISSGRSFAAVYCELLYLREFARHAGNANRDKAVRHLARALQGCGDPFQSQIFRVGHMGGGHFVTIIEPEHAMAYSMSAQELWHGHVPELYASAGQSAALSNGGHGGAGGSAGATPVVATLFCVAIRDSRSRMSSRELFEVLSHLRQTALTSGEGGIYVDRRGGLQDAGRSRQD